MHLNATREDFLAAAEVARGRPLEALYREAGIAAGPSRRRLRVAGLELPLRLFVALALRRRLGPEAELRGLSHEACLAVVGSAGLSLKDAHESERPIRTG